MTTNGDLPPRRAGHDEPIEELFRDVCDLADSAVAKISDAHVEGHLRRVLEKTAPQVAAELLRQEVARIPAGSAQHDFLVARLADALYRAGDTAAAEQVANEGLAHVGAPDAFVDLHWTLAQCRMLSGRYEDSLATLDRALDSPEIPAQCRARMLVLVARTHSNWGEVDKAAEAAEAARAAASQTGDRWAMGWALHVLTIVTATQGHMTDALPLFEQAIAVTQTDPALTDLWLLLQINQAVTLGNLDRYEEALAAARQAQHLAHRRGSAVRLAQAHGALGQLLFNAGCWDDALAEIEILHEDLEEPSMACCDLGIAAAICFHRGKTTMARRHLAAAEPYAKRIGKKRLIWPLALARSLDSEHAGALAEALAVLTAAFTDTEEFDDIEDLLPDAARLAAQTSDVRTMKAVTDYAAALAAGSDIPRRQATALYCQALLDHDATGLLTAAERYRRAGRPLLAAAALEAAAGEFARADDCDHARAAFTRADEIFTSLSAAVDVARLRTKLRAHGIHRDPPVNPQPASSSWDSLTLTKATISVIVEGGLPNQPIPTKLQLT
jgi:tetratricopeptide (TPR) repeat protein